MPQCLLSFFSTPGRGDEEQVRAFDKHDRREFRVGTGGILAQRYFNTLELDDMVIDAEAALGRIENAAAPLLRRIVADQSIEWLTPEDRTNTALFLAAQFIRGPDTRARLGQILDGVQARVAWLRDGEAEAPQQNDQAAKIQAIQLFFEATPRIAAMLGNKAWFLFTPQEGEFFLGDSPIAMHNDRDFGPYGNIGLIVPGIQIYFPISPTILLAMWCPDLIEQISAKQDEIGGMENRLRGLALLGVGDAGVQARSMMAHLADLKRPGRQVLDAVERGGSVSASPEELTFINHLQVRSAERYLIAKNQPFDLAGQMIDDNQRYAMGQRLQMN